VVILKTTGGREHREYISKRAKGEYNMERGLVKKKKSKPENKSKQGVPISLTHLATPSSTYPVSLRIAAEQLLDLVDAIRAHMGCRDVSRSTPEGAHLWFKVLEQMRINEALLQEQLRRALNG